MDKKVTIEQVTQDAARVVQDMQAGRSPYDPRNRGFDPTVRAATVAFLEAQAADAEYRDARAAVETAPSLIARIVAEEDASKAFAAREAAKRAFSAHLR